MWSWIIGVHHHVSMILDSSRLGCIISQDHVIALSSLACDMDVKQHAYSADFCCVLEICQLRRNGWASGSRCSWPTSRSGIQCFNPLARGAWVWSPYWCESSWELRTRSLQRKTVQRHVGWAWGALSRSAGGHCERASFGGWGGDSSRFSYPGRRGGGELPRENQWIYQ